MVTGQELELNLRHHGNEIEYGNELMRMGGNENVACHSRTSLLTPFGFCAIFKDEPFKLITYSVYSVLTENQSL